MRKSGLGLFFALIAWLLAGADLESLPRVFPADTPVTVTVTVNDRKILDALDRKELSVRLNHTLGETANGTRSTAGDPIRVKCKDNRLSFQTAFPGEQEHTLRFVLPAAGERKREQELGKLSFFSLAPETFALRPFKGDLHAHSEGSDGRGTPEAVVAYGRKAGWDFMALTDHWNCAPAQQAKAKHAAFPSGYEVIVGEEAHANKVRTSMIHMVALNIDRSVTQHLIENKAWFEAEIAARKKTYQPPAALPEYAVEEVIASEIMADLTRQFGGIAILAHPFWQPRGSLSAHPEYVREVLRRGKFEAFEFVSGSSTDKGLMKMAGWYNDRRAEGISSRMVGTSDDHDVSRPTYGGFYTIVLAPDGGGAAVAAAIRDGRCGAVRKYGPEIAPAIFCESRYFDYLNFLERNYFPEHAKLCARQGELLLKAVAGESSVLPEIAALRDRIGAYRASFFMAAPADGK